MLNNAKFERVTIITPLRLRACMPYTFADGFEINIRDVAPPMEERAVQIPIEV